MSKYQKGFTEILALVAGFLTLATLFFGFIFLVAGIRVEMSEQSVSGVAYNTTHNAWLSGNTRFSIRAAENTLVTEENQSSYCLPPGSPYIELVDKASKNKDIKLVITTEKVFTYVMPPWTCIENVKVEVLDQ